MLNIGDKIGLLTLIKKKRKGRIKSGIGSVLKVVSSI